MSGEGYNGQFAWEHDDRQRSCKVYLYRRPLVDLLAYHWSLYFDWDDYDATYEADDEDGYLVPRWCKGKPSTPSGFMKMEIGKSRFSPQHVNEKARRNKYSGKRFILTMVNCQVWATELARSLGLNIPIPCNLVQILHPPLGLALSAAHFFGLFGKKTSGSGWS